MWKKVRHWENIHIPLWLMKDTCWMLEWKILGITLIFPTIFVALYLAFKTRKETEFLINLAICFWISANAYWMSCEFFKHIELKMYAIVPFVAGMICVALFYFNSLQRNKTRKEN